MAHVWILDESTTHPQLKLLFHDMVPNFMDTVKLGMKQDLEHQNRAKTQDDFTNNSNPPAYNKYICIM